jgi:hypothetical protein
LSDAPFTLRHAFRAMAEETDRSSDRCGKEDFLIA